MRETNPTPNKEISSEQLSPAEQNELQLRTNRMVAQHNDLIRARYEMTLLEARLFVALLGRINKGDKEFVLCRIPVSELYPDDRIGGKTYSQVKKAVVRLAGRVITVETTDEKGVREIVSNPMMATCRYKEGSGYVVAQFNSFVKPYLLDLKGDFTTAQQLTLLGFQSFYSHRLYWLIKESAYYQDNIRIDLASLKSMLNLSDRYSNFADFKRFVLEVAKEEIAQTDMAFEYSTLKEGRNVVGLLFHLLRPAVVVDDAELPEGVQQTLTQIGVSLKSLQEIKNRYQQGKLSEPYIRFVLHYFQQPQTKSRIKSLSGAIFKALIADQLMAEFTAWQAEQPVYKAPPQKNVPEAVSQIIPVEELRSGYEVMKQKGLSEHPTFEAFLASYQADPSYRLDEIDGRQVLIYSGKS